MQKIGALRDDSAHSPPIVTDGRGVAFYVGVLGGYGGDLRVGRGLAWANR